MIRSKFLRAAAPAMLTVAAAMSVAQGHKAGEAEIKPYMDTYGYVPRVETKSELERGEQVYVQWCAICHRDGPGMAGTAILKMRYKGKLPALLEERTDLTAATIESFVRQGAGAMPYFRKTEISDKDLAALTSYMMRKDT